MKAFIIKVLTLKSKSIWRPVFEPYDDSRFGDRDSCWPLCSEEPADQPQAAAAAFSFIGFLLKFFGEEGGPSDINTLEYIQILPRECFRQEALALPCITWEFPACLSASFLICHWGVGWTRCWDFIRNVLTWEMSRTGSVLSCCFVLKILFKF